jgi:hypothetical protein
MKKWALLALFGPTAAFAGPFSITDAASGHAVEVAYTWTLPNTAVFTGGATFTFGSPVADLSQPGPCSLGLSPLVDDYCFTGTFSTNNSGFGTYTSRVVVDTSSCVYNAAGQTPYNGSTFFQRAQAECDLQQEIIATFADTTVTYTIKGGALGIDYDAVFSGSGTTRRLRGPNPFNPTVLVTAPGPNVLFDDGFMVGDNGTVLVNGTFTEIP